MMLVKLRVFKKNPALADIDGAYAPADAGSGAVIWRSLQLLMWAAAIAGLAWALSAPQFRNAEGFQDSSIGVPVAISVALLVMGWAITRRLKAFAFWLAMALIGQAATLQLIDAGPSLRYQHYQPWDQLFTEVQPLLLVFLATQTVLVAAGLRAHYGKVWGWLHNNFKTWQLVTIGLLLVLSSAVVSPRVPVYVGEVGLAVFLQIVQLGTIFLMVSALPESARTWWQRFVERIIGPLNPRDEPEPGRPDRFVVVVALWVIALAALLSFSVYERHPHVPDEVAYLYHARFLASGALTKAVPPVPEAFETYLMQVDGDVWYPAPPVGWPAVLAVGALLGVAWLVNPLLAGLNVLLAYLLLREIFSRRSARISILLLAVSPWYVFMGMNFMTHMFTLTCALLASLGVAWARRTDKTIWAWLGGLALGFMALVRPLEAVAAAAFLGLWAIGFGGKRLKVSAIAGLVVGAMLMGSVTLLYNQVITGDPKAFPIMVYADQFFGPNSNALGFGSDRGMGWAIDPYPGHSPRDGVINANLNIASINVEMLGWSIGSLLIAGVMVFSGTLRRSDYLMLAVIAAVFTPHFFYYFSGGPDFGARYWFLMIIPGVALTARGIQFLEGRLSARSEDLTQAAGEKPGPSPLTSGESELSQSTPPSGTAQGGPNFPLVGGGISASGGAWVTVAVVVLSLLTVVNYFPWRSLDKYHDFRGMRPDVRIMAEEYNFGRSLVLVRGDRYPDYASASIYNPLDLQADAPVYVWDRSPEVRAQVLAVYPDRPVWIIDGPSITKSGYQIVAGPLRAGELLATQGKIP